TSAYGDLSGDDGTFNVGDGANVATASVTRIVQSTVNVSDLSTLSTVASTTGVGTNSGSISSIGTLNLNSTGVYNLSNKAMVVGTNTTTATVRQYLTNGYAGGAWNGTGGINSSWAANDTTHQRALGYGAQPDGSTLVTATLYG